MDRQELERLAELLGANAFPALALLTLVVVALFLALLVVGHWVGTHRGTVRAWIGAGWKQVTGLAPVRRLGAAVPWVGRVASHLTARQFLLIYLLLGLALSIGALGFLRLARTVAGEAEITYFDVELAEALHRGVTPAGARTLEWVTMLGSVPALTALGLVVTIVLLRRRETVLAIGWVVAMLGAALLNVGLKELFQRPRPVVANPILVLETWSFPSGHAMGTFVAFGMLAYLVIVLVPARAVRLAAAALALAWILLIGFTRMYLGVHYFSDVVGGYLAGTVWLGACITGIEALRRRRRDGDVVAPPAATVELQTPKG